VKVRGLGYRTDSMPRFVSEKPRHYAERPR
jgi:hypothetical protein